MSEIQSLISTFQETVGSFRDEIEKQRVRVDELEALTKRAHAGGPRAAAAGDEETLLASHGLQILRKGHSLTDLLPQNQRSQPLSLAKILKGIYSGDWSGAEAERESITHKGQSISPDTAGGYLLPTLVAAQVVDLARSQSVCMRAGAGTIQVAGDTVFPRVMSDPTPEWRGENTALPVSETVLGAFNVIPKTLGVLIPVSIELIEDGGPAVERMLRTVLANTCAAELDRVMLTGDGAAEPCGLLASPQVKQETGVGALTYDDILDAVGDVYGANFGGAESDLSVILNPRTHNALAKEKESTTDAYLRPPVIFERMQKYQTTALKIATTTTDAIVGDFRQLNLVMRTGLTIEMSRAASPGFSKMQVMVRAYLRCGVVAFQPSHFVALRGITN